MEQCKKANGHFDLSSFSAGIMLISVIGIIIAAIFSTDYTIHREAKLPETCRTGQQILMTTAPTAELWVCDKPKWVRR